MASVAILVFAVLWGSLMTIRWQEITGMCVKNIREMQVTIGEWVKRATFEDDLIAANDVGAIFYISRRPVLDLVGLVTPEIIPRVRMIEGKRERGKALFAFLFEKKPDYLIIFPNWYPTLASDKDLFVEVFRISLRDNVICGGDEMIVYKCFWHRYREDRQ